MKLEDHVYKWDRVVIGSDLRSLLYSISHNIPIIFKEVNAPFRFEAIPDDVDLAKIGIRGEEIKHQRELWEKLFFVAGLSGLSPMSSNAQNIRVKDRTLVITTKNSRVVKAEFHKLIVFEDTQLQTLPNVTREERANNKVIDWFNIRYGCRHNWDFLCGDDNFVNRVYFYPTDRSDNKSLKDAVSVSYLSDEEVGDLDFSEYLARFKLEQMMKDAGIKGPINGYRNNKPIHLGVKAEHAEREVVSCSKRRYEPDDRYEFVYDSLQCLIEGFELSGYADKLMKAI